MRYHAILGRSLGSAALLALAAAAQAAVYYVDSAGGDDARDGASLQTAWKTVGKVNAREFLPGDSVLFRRGGLWREMLRVRSSGEKGKPITFGAYGQGELPVLCGADVIVGWAKEPGQANVWSVVVDKATPPREPDDGSVFDGSGTSYLWFDGQLGRRAATQQKISAEANWYYDGYKLYVYAADDPARLYTKPGIELPVRLEGIRLDERPYAQRDRKHVIIEDLRLYKIRRWAVDAINTDSVTIRRCTVEWVGPGNKWRDYANDPVAIGLNHNTANALVEGCLLHDCGCGVYIGTAQPGYAARGNSVRFNQIYNVRSGINAKVHATGGVFEGNYIHDVETQGIRTVGDEQAGNVIVRNFVTRCAEEGIQLRNHHVVAYNVVSACRFASVIIISDTGETEDRINGGDNNEICNNVFYDTPEHVGVSFANPKGTDVKGNVIRNNVFANVFLPIRFSGGIPEGGGGNVVDYNCYWNANPKAPYGRQPGQMALEEWKGKLGWDAHSVFADAGFVTAQPKDARDFALQGGSPCIDAGTDVGQPADFLGAPVPHGRAADMGAFEFGSAGAQPAATWPSTAPAAAENDNEDLGKTR